MSEIVKDEHIHVWTRTLDGAELGNALYYNDLDAAMDFLGMARAITKYHTEADIKIEDVMDSLIDGRGMYAGFPGLIVVVSRCDGGCKSPTWN